MTQLVINHVKELAVKQGYCTLKFFNRKKQELVLWDVDLLETKVTSKENISDDPGFSNLPLDEGAPGRLLDGPEEDLEVDEGIDALELADLLDDETENPPQPCTESEGDELNVPDGDAVEDMDDGNQLQSEDVFQHEDNDIQEPELISDDEVKAILDEDPTAEGAEDVW